MALGEHLPLCTLPSHGSILLKQGFDQDPAVQGVVAEGVEKLPELPS